MFNRTFKHIITYRRWSTLEQGNKDRSSDDRQIANTNAFLRELGWTFTETHVDAGRSAFTGANLTKGELGKLTTRLLTGALDPSETLIVVEELDRLSRQPPGTMTAWMQPLLMAGVTFAVTNTRTIVDEAKMNDFGSFVALMSQAFSAYEFSRKQRDRGNGSWSKRRKAAGEGRNIARHRCRGWLKWDSALNNYVELPDRAWLVREMFRLRLEKRMGKGDLAKLFNSLAGADDRYRAFSSSRVQPKHWTASAIARIIHDPAVTGFIQYYNNPRGAEQRIAVGDPVKVYPEIVSQETFALANENRLTNQLKAKGRGRSVSNILGPLARCGACGGTMQPLGSSRFRINKDGSRSQHYFLYCQIAKMTKGVDCSNQRGWTYSRIEAPILDRLLTLALDDLHFQADTSEAARLEGTVVRLQRKLSDQQSSAKRMFVAMGEQDAEDYEIAAYEDAKRAIRDTKAELDKAQKELADAKGQVSPAEHVVRVHEVRQRMESDDPDARYIARLTVKSALVGIVDSIVFNPRDGSASVTLVAGLGLMIIHDDGNVIHFDLHHRARDHAGAVSDIDQVEAIRGFMRRNAA